MFSYKAIARSFEGTSRLHRLFSTSTSAFSDYSHTIIGAGVVGLAIAAELSKNPANNILLLEKNAAAGQETSSRNSEVIHAGIYYPTDSLKTKLCIRGSQLIYERAKSSSIEVQKCGKWLVAQNDIEDAYLENLHHICKSEKGVPTNFVSLREAKFIEPSIVAKASILNSPNTGILSVHSLIDYLQAVAQNSGNVDFVTNSEVIDLKKDTDGGFVLTTIESSIELDDSTKEPFEISSEVVINSAGLYAAKISNLLLPESRHVKYRFAKGNYFTPTIPTPPVRRLIYPIPMAGLKGLGTHLTISLDGQIKFGPDVEIVESPNDYLPSPKNIDSAFKEIFKYFPQIPAADCLTASYSGIRPQLDTGKPGFVDFIIREEEGFSGFINLLNIESPGLTSSMALAEYVAKLLK